MCIWLIIYPLLPPPPAQQQSLLAPPSPQMPTLPPDHAPISNEVRLAIFCALPLQLTSSRPLPSASDGAPPEPFSSWFPRCRTTNWSLRLSPFYTPMSPHLVYSVVVVGFMPLATDCVLLLLLPIKLARVEWGCFSSSCRTQSLILLTLSCCHRQWRCAWYNVCHEKRLHVPGRALLPPSIPHVVVRNHDCHKSNLAKSPWTTTPSLWNKCFRTVEVKYKVLAIIWRLLQVLGFHQIWKFV